MKGGYQLFDLGELLYKTSLSAEDIASAEELVSCGKPVLVTIDGLQFHCTVSENNGKVNFCFSPYLNASNKVVCDLYQLDISTGDITDELIEIADGPTES